MLVGVRERLIRMRTQVVNSIRGYAAEFDLAAAKGICRIEQLVDRLACDRSVPSLARTLFATQGKIYRQLEEEIAETDKQLVQWHRADERASRLAEIPGVGLIGASLLTMKAPAPELFASARQFTDWMELAPRDHSTGGKTRTGKITRAGDEGLRSVLVADAKALLRHVRTAASMRALGCWTF